MSETKARTLKGFRDYLPEVEIPRSRMLRRVVDVFESFGFSPLSTPALEYSEVLLGKCGDDGDKLLYRFEDNGGRDVALRYDLTVPLARVVAQHGHLDRPFKRYQIAPVWRAEKPARGRFREFMQCDVDIVGEASVRADAECMMVGIEVLNACGVPDYEMRMNHRGVLDGMLDRAGIDHEAQRLKTLRVLDKLDKIGRDGVSAELTEGVGLGGDAIARLFEIVERPVGGLDDLKALGDLFTESERGRAGAEALHEILGILDTAGHAEHVRVDLSIARGLDYYTGAIYETFILGRENFGSVMSGGRYDELLGRFAKQSIPAVGICLGVDRLISALVDLNLLDGGSGTTHAYIVLFDGSDFGRNAKLAQTLREAGVGVEMSLSAKKLGKQFKAAERKGCRFVLMLGEEEAAQGLVQIKDLETGSQEAVELGQAANWLSGKIKHL